MGLQTVGLQSSCWICVHSQQWNWSVPYWGALQITAHHWWHQPALSQERTNYLFGTDYAALLKSSSRWGNKEKATLFFECSSAQADGTIHMDEIIKIQCVNALRILPSLQLRDFTLGYGSALLQNPTQNNYKELSIC